jgi:ankyrin repeat protein
MPVIFRLDIGSRADSTSAYLDDLLRRKHLLNNMAFMQSTNYSTKDCKKMNNLSDQLSTKCQLTSDGGHVAVVKELLAQGANVHALDDLALDSASIRRHVEVVKELLAHGANVHARSDQALRWASWNGRLEVVKELLAQGADVHAKDDEALRWASQNGYLEVVKELLAHGASPRAKMVQQARLAGHYEIADLHQAKLGKLSKIAQYLNSRLFPAKPASAV